MASTEKRFQSTTVRLPKHVYEQAKKALLRARASSFNEFVVRAIEEKMTRLSEAAIDAEFAGMAHDPEYQNSAIALARHFEKSDWDAYASSGTSKPSNTHARPSKTRAR